MAFKTESEREENSKTLINAIDDRYTSLEAKTTALHTLVCLDIDLPQHKECIREMYCTITLAKQYDKWTKERYKEILGGYSFR